jgi:hypothetical protein
MAITVANEVKKAALDGICAIFNGGQFRLDTSGDAELATPTFNATAFGAATTASPSVATANAFTADATPTAGTIAKFLLSTSGSALRINGSVGVGSGDLQVSDNVIPADATEVTVASFQLSLQIT